MLIEKKEKKRSKHSFLAFLLLSLLVPTAGAAVVDSSEALSVATRFAYLNNIKGLPTLVATINNESLSVPALYLFNISEDGYVVVSGDDCVRPIMAFSNQGNIRLDYLPDGFKSYLRQRADEVSYGQNHGLPASPEVAAQWEKLRVPQPKSGQRKDGLTYLMSSTWDQGWPYNAYCPEIDYNTAPVGCVATAMSQIMHFWRHPAQGVGSTSYMCQACRARLSADFGSTTYDYDHMPDVLYYDCDEEEKEAVALFCYHVGISVWMQYESYTSGVDMSDVGPYCRRALRKNFDYDTNVRYLHRSAYSSAAWVDTIKNEIEAGRPVLYAGYDNGSTGNDAGHAFVLDGYDSESNTFHVNWGWGGSCDGWCDLYNSALVAYDYHFTSLQLAVVGIQPAPEPAPEPEPEPEPEPQGIGDIASVSAVHISVYPNPANGKVNITYHTEHPTTLRISSVTGQHLAEIPVGPGNDHTIFDTSKLPAGIYFCTLDGSTVKFAVSK